MQVSRVFALTVLCSGVALHAQTAQVSGRVTDGSGAVVPATSITVTNAATNIARSTQTNTDGYYAVPLLPPGAYRLNVEQQGFRPITRSGITLEVEQRAELN